MTSHEEAPAGAAHARRRPARTLIVAGTVVLAAAFGAVVAIPLGGWDTVRLETSVVPELPVGETYEGRHYSVSIHGAWVGVETPDEYESPPEDGMTFVFVRATVRNEWREPDTGAARLVRFDALDELASIERSAQLRVVADGEFAGTSQPGVTTDVLLRWEVPAASVAPGEPLELGVVDGRPEPAVLYSGTAWRDERVVAVTTIVPRPSDELEYPWEA
jgi:hypothetical protein